MIRIEGRAVTYGELWFDEDATDGDSVDVLIYRHRPTPVESTRCTPSLTLVTDLKADEKVIMGTFGGTTRYEINRAGKKDGVQARVIAPTTDAVAAFCDFYDAFARQKSLPPAYRRGLLAASRADQLVLTTALSGDEVLVWHAYIVCRDAAALLYSASLFRHRSNAERALVGRANRWLHWHDMLHLKRTGLERYDWGGVFQDESSAERAGINGFKYEFGGQRHMTYDCTRAVTIKGRAYLAARAVLNQVSPDRP